MSTFRDNLISYSLAGSVGAVARGWEYNPKRFIFRKKFERNLAVEVHLSYDFASGNTVVISQPRLVIQSRLYSRNLKRIFPDENDGPILYFMSNIPFLNYDAAQDLKEIFPQLCPTFYNHDPGFLSHEMGSFMIDRVNNFVKGLMDMVDNFLPGPYNLSSEISFLESLPHYDKFYSAYYAGAAGAAAGYCICRLMCGDTDSVYRMRDDKSLGLIERDYRSIDMILASADKIQTLPGYNFNVG